MKITFVDMAGAPDRDVTFRWRAVCDDNGVRYPVEIMLDHVAVVDFSRQTRIEECTDVVEALYREVLEQNVRKLNTTDNTVFIRNGRDPESVRPGDNIVINEAVGKLVATAKRLGKL